MNNSQTQKGNTWYQSFNNLLELYTADTFAEVPRSMHFQLRRHIAPYWHFVAAALDIEKFDITSDVTEKNDLKYTQKLLNILSNRLIGVSNVMKAVNKVSNIINNPEKNIIRLLSDYQEMHQVPALKRLELSLAISNNWKDFAMANDIGEYQVLGKIPPGSNSEKCAEVLVELLCSRCQPISGIISVFKKLNLSTTTASSSTPTLFRPQPQLPQKQTPQKIRELHNFIQLLQKNYATKENFSNINGAPRIPIWKALTPIWKDVARALNINENNIHPKSDNDDYAYAKGLFEALKKRSIDDTIVNITIALSTMQSQASSPASPRPPQ